MSKINLKKSLALLLAAVLLLALTACGGNSNKAGLGKPLSTMFFDYTVLSAEVVAEYDGYTPEEGNKLVLCSVKVKNDFGEELLMFDTDFQIQWGEGDEDFAWSVETFNNQMMPAEYDLANKAEVTYDLLFEVPEEITRFSLVYLEEYTDRSGNSETGELYEVVFKV